MQLAMSLERKRTPGVAVGVIVAAVGGVVALLALRTAHAAPDLGYASWSPWGATELVLPGLVALGVALESLRRHARDRSALLLALAATASFLPELSVAGTRPAAAFTIGLVFAWSMPPLVAHLALSYPGRRLSTSARVVRDLGYLCAIAGLGVLPALVFDPVERGCGQCSTNLTLLDASTNLQTVFVRAGIIATLTWVAAWLVLIVHRLARATPAARRLLWPVLAPAAVLIGCFAVELAVSFDRAYLSTEGFDRRLWIGGQAALVAMAVGVALRWLRARRARGLLARDVVELSAHSASGTVAVRLSAVLGDPTLEVAYAVGDPSRLVDGRGSPVDLAPYPGRATTFVDDGRAVLLHREGLLDDPALVDEIARAARLALANERLRADARARMALLQASRKRIVGAADDERQRLERNLHDGAQQRLVSLAVTLRATRGESGRDSALLDEAQGELAHALDELRVIARGIYPAVLAELGFAAAIEALAETAPTPLKVGTLPLDRLDPIVEATAYFIVAECVHNTAAGSVTVNGDLDGDTLMLAVSTDTETGDLTRLSDRVGAVGGTIRRRPLLDKIILEVEIPCVS